MAPIKTMRNILMELRKTCQHPYLSAPELEDESLPEAEQHKRLYNASGKLAFLRILLPKLKERGHRVLLFSQFKIALDRIEDFLYGEGYKFLRLDGDVKQAQRQKSMDAFNAPDSDVFIFLLTTRAGGVGINLATADTVIMYDPDFNPHMDLQAIARSHRYGQKKPCLVFKLMSKDSVEEQIIWKGKKKMVLDHLVVQQMGKENEEGDIDNILLHGAKALYETDANGVAPSDIQYNSKNVDELIDKVEREAETEAAALAEKEARLARGEAAEDATKSKESMTFGFAKIWEADKDELQEVPNEDEADDVAVMDDTWQTIMENAARDRERRLEEEGRARRRKAAAVQYMVEPAQLSDNSPAGKKKPKKGKRKKNAASSDDAEFAMPVDGEESDSDETTASMYRESIENLLDEAGGSSSALKSHKGIPDPAKMAELAKRLADATSALASKADTGQPGAPPSKKRRGNESPEERAARKAQDKAAKMEQLKKAYDAAVAQQKQSHAAASGRSNGQTPFSSGALAGPSALPASVKVDPTRIKQAQDILQWLYSVLREMEMMDEVKVWAMMGIPELPKEERKAFYAEIAKKVDDRLAAYGRARYFAQDTQAAAVMYLFNAAAPIIPSDFGQSVPAFPPEARKAIRPPHTIAQPSAGPSQAPPAANGAYHHQPIAAPAGSSGASPNMSRNPSPNVAPARIPSGPNTVHCPLCEGPHILQECPTFIRAPRPEKLRKHREELLSSSKSEQEKRTHCAAIDKLLELHRLAGTSPEPQAASSPAAKPTACSSQRRQPSGLGSRDAAIVIDDDEDGPELSSSHHSRSNGRFRGCTICGSPHPHVAVQCPVVKAGPESAEAALQRMDPSDPMYPILQSLVHGQRTMSGAGSVTAGPIRVCPFCDTLCDLPLRECVETKGGPGGRRLLKARIRELEGLKSSPGMEAHLQPKLDELFACYAQWPNPAKMKKPAPAGQ